MELTSRVQFFDKHIYPCNHHHDQDLEHHYYPKRVPLAPLHQSPPHPNPNHLSAFYWYSFVCSEIAYKWNYTVHTPV